MHESPRADPDGALWAGKHGAAVVYKYLDGEAFRHDQQVRILPALLSERWTLAQDTKGDA